MLPAIVLIVIGVILAPCAVYLGWSYSGEDDVVTGVVAFLTGLALVLSLIAVRKRGIETYLRVSIEVLLAAVLLFTVLALGGCPSWTWLVSAAGVALAVVFWALRMMVEGRVAWVKTPLNILLLLLAAYIFFQLVPLPAGILRSFQSNTLRFHTMGPPSVEAVAKTPLAGEGSCPISLYRARTRGQFLLLLTYVGFFLVFINNIRGRAQLGRMIGVLFTAGALVALAGFATDRMETRFYYRMFPVGSENEKPWFLNRDANVEESAGYMFWFGEQEAPLQTASEAERPATTPDATDATPPALPPTLLSEEETRVAGEKQQRQRVDWYVRKVHGGDVFGGFPSSNSAATLMVMLIAAGLGTVFAYIATRRSEWGQSGGLLYSREGNITLLAVFVVVLLLAGLWITRSRGAVAVAACIIPLLVVLNAFSRSLKAGILTLVIVAVVVFVPLVIIGPGTVAGFVEQKAGVMLNPWEEDTRMLARETSWKIIHDFRMFGTGLGTYGNVYANYLESGRMLAFAHCDVLQWMVETGLVGTLLAGAILVTGLVTVIVGHLRLKDPFFRRMLLGTSVGCLAFLLHGITDFPLAVPGVTLVFVALAAASIVLARDQVARHEENDFIF